MILLYIDPGTGSALFAILFAIISALYFMSKTAIVKLKTVFFGKSSLDLSKTENLVIYSEGKKYFLVFKSILEELEKRNYPTLYLTSDENDPLLTRNENSSVKTQYIGKGNLAYARLNMLSCNTVLMTTPGLDVYQLKRSKKVHFYAHILHAVDDATSYRLFGLDYFDAVLLSGTHQVEPLRQLEEKREQKKKDLVIVGSTYLDEYAKKIDTFVREKKKNYSKETVSILIAPSWGPSGLLARYGLELLEPLAHSSFEIIIRPHPQSYESEKEIIEALEKKLSKYSNIIWDKEVENLSSLSTASILISDFSSIIFDYAFLFGGPILYALSDFDPRLYDAGDLEEEPWKFKTTKELAIELKKEDFPKLPDIIQNALTDPSRANLINKIKNTAWQNQGLAAKLTVDYLIQQIEKNTFEGENA